MKKGVLQVIRNDNYGVQADGNSPKRKIYSVRFLIFVILSLMVFGGIFFIKDKVDKYKSMEENLSFQRQKIVEERVLIEKTLKQEMSNLEALKLEYNQKNLELSEKLEEIRIKEDALTKELSRVTELKDMLKDQLVALYDINMDKIYSSDDDKEGSKNSGAVTTDDNSQEVAKQSMILGDGEEGSLTTQREKILGVANADWFIKLDSLGEFTY